MTSRSWGEKNPFMAALHWERSPRLRLARAYALQRDAGLSAYKDFLTLWKDADPDIPILKQAKTEYAKLQ